MRKRPWTVRIIRGARWLVPGAALMGSSCAADLRDVILAAGVDFVGDWIAAILSGYLPAA